VSDQPSTPALRFGPGLIAFLAVLAIAAGSAGYFGARSVLAANDSPNASRPSNGPTSSGGPNGGGGTQSGPAQTSGSVPTTAPQVAAGDPSACPQPTVTALAHAGLDSTLSVLLYIRVHRAGEYDSEVWICQNAAGLLVYQGHIMRAVLDVATGNSSLLLAEGIVGTVTGEPDGSFLATNTTPAGKITEYQVSRTQLVIVNEPGDKNRQVYPVVVAKP
jgi:hypothetical protein